MNHRKLIAHGPSSLTISLPSKWLKKHHLKKGSAVFVEEDENGNLEVRASPRDGIRSMAIDISGYDAREIFTVLTTIYRRGYDELRVRYASSSEYEALTAGTRQCLGYAVVEHKSGSCVIRLLAESEFSDFHTLFRKVFYVLLQELDDLAAIVSNPKELANFSRRDADVNILVNLALRLINKGYVPSRFHELHLYYALLMLEEMGDDLLRCSLEWRDGSFDAKEVQESLRACKEMLSLLSEQFFEEKGNIGEFYRRYYLYDTTHPHYESGKVPVPQWYVWFRKRGPALFYPRCFIEKIVALAETLLLPAIKEL